MNKLQGKIILVTGASGLLGKPLIEQLKASGAIGINADINVKTNLDQGEIFCDITQEQSIDDAIAAILGKYGRIDGLVNNAYPRTKDWGVKFEQIPNASWKQNIDLQLNSVFLCCQKILAVMQKQQFGSIVNISSIYGTVGPDFNIYEGTEMTMPAAYSAIKGGIANFSRYLASYYGKDQIRINCVSPGGIWDHQPDSFVTHYNNRVPMKRMGKPEDIAPAICFLLSDDASYITGQNLHVDGGWTAI